MHGGGHIGSVSGAASSSPPLPLSAAALPDSADSSANQMICVNFTAVSGVHFEASFFQGGYSNLDFCS